MAWANWLPIINNVEIIVFNNRWFCEYAANRLLTNIDLKVHSTVSIFVLMWAENALSGLDVHSH